MNDVQTLLPYLTLLGFGISSMLASFRVGAAIGEARQAMKDAAETKAVVAMIPLMKKEQEDIRRDLSEVKDTMRNVSGRLHSDLPPMREKMSSYADDLEELKSVRAAERLRVLEDRTGLSSRGMQAQRPPRPSIPRKDPDDG